jgi:hypothetical protein
MSNWIGVLPVIGIGSLEGFALGVLASGACFLALTTSWRPRGREAGERYDLSSRPRQDGARVAAAVREDPTPAAKPADQPRDSRAGRARTQRKPGGQRAGHPPGDPALGSAAGQGKPPGGRRSPRHAAPSPGLSSKITGLSHTRSLADDSRG